MGQFQKSGVKLPPGEFGIPPEDPNAPRSVVPLKGRWGAGGRSDADLAPLTIGLGKARTAGGMVYVSTVGPVDPETGQVMSGAIKDQTRQCLKNLKAKLEEAGSSLEKIVWANWSLREASEFDGFNEEWVRWFPGDGPVGQGTLMPPLQRRAGFRISIGVIAEA
jgi:2-iminobutanoate/2-iminopropanoate deaminase